MNEKTIKKILKRIYYSEDIYDARRAVYDEFFGIRMNISKNIPVKILILSRVRRYNFRV